MDLDMTVNSFLEELIFQVYKTLCTISYFEYELISYTINNSSNNTASHF